jgi:predicted RecA/RadA family phage recombinase
MKNFIQPGDALDLTAPSGGVVSGSVYLINGMVVVASNDAAEATPFVGNRVGAYSLTKVGSQAWSEADPVYWDNSAKNFTKTATANTFAGFAIEAVGSGAGETTGKVLLIGAGHGAAPLVQSAHIADLSVANVTGVDGTGSNAASKADVDAGFNSVETKVNAIFDALEAAGILATS